MYFFFNFNAHMYKISRWMNFEIADYWFMGPDAPTLTLIDGAGTFDMPPNPMPTSFAVSPPIA